MTMRVEVEEMHVDTQRAWLRLDTHIYYFLRYARGRFTSGLDAFMRIYGSALNAISGRFCVPFRLRLPPPDISMTPYYAYYAAHIYLHE